MADITMTCAPGSYSAGGDTTVTEKRDFYDREGNVLTLTQKQMMQMCTEDPGSIVPVQITPKDSVDQSIIDEIAKRKLMQEAK